MKYRGLVSLPFIVGNRYMQQDGTWVKLVQLRDVNTLDETVMDEHEVLRYSNTARQDMGRVVGSPEDYSDLRNIIPHRVPQSRTKT